MRNYTIDALPNNPNQAGPSVPPGPPAPSEEVPTVQVAPGEGPTVQVPTIQGPTDEGPTVQVPTFRAVIPPSVPANYRPAPGTYSPIPAGPQDFTRPVPQQVMTSPAQMVPPPSRQQVINPPGPPNVQVMNRPIPPQGINQPLPPQGITRPVPPPVQDFNQPLPPQVPPDLRPLMQAPPTQPRPFTVPRSYPPQYGPPPPAPPPLGPGGGAYGGPVAPPPKPKKSWLLWVIAGVGVLLVIGAAVALVFLLLNGNGQSGQPTVIGYRPTATQGVPPTIPIMVTPDTPTLNPATPAATTAVVTTAPATTAPVTTPAVTTAPVTTAPATTAPPSTVIPETTQATTVVSPEPATIAPMPSTAPPSTKAATVPPTKAPTKAPTVTPVGQDVANAVAKVVASLPDSGGVMVLLENGQTIEKHAEEVRPAASLITLWIAGAAYQEAVNGNLDWSETYVIKASDQVPGTGILNQPAYTGKKIEYGDIMYNMLVHSDNTAANILIGRIGGFDTVNQFAIDNNYSQTILQRRLGIADPAHENYTTARDVATFLDDLMYGNLVDYDTCDAILSLMFERLAVGDNAQDNGVNFFGAALPSEVEYFQISGQLTGTRNTAGAFNSPNDQTVIVVVMLSGQSDDKAAEQMISKAITQIYSVKGL